MYKYTWGSSSVFNSSHNKFKELEAKQFYFTRDPLLQNNIKFLLSNCVYLLANFFAKVFNLI